MASLRDQIKMHKIGIKRKILNNIYFIVLKMSWLYFILYFVFAFIITNTLFALLYMSSPGSVSNIESYSFWRYFVFSCQTFSTVGYGYYLPITSYAHFIAVVENIAGILFTAIMTGLTFSKFSRPTSTVIFSKIALIANYDGIPTLMFRIGNGRDTSIVDAKVSVVTFRIQTTIEGHSMQRFVDVKLVRNKSPFFIFSWTVMHQIDEQSPFYNYSKSDFISNNINLYVTLNGFDETLSETVHNGWVYKPEHIFFGEKFVDVVQTQPDGTRILDFNKFHDFI